MAPVHIESDGPVYVVSLDRPEARNAVDGETARDLFAAFEEFDTNPSFSVAILTGRSGTFCAGADLKAIGTSRANQVRAEGPGPMGPTRMVLSKPVIAAVEGFAVAGGLELALWCDLRVAAINATFGVFCRRWGVPLIDGGTIRLPRLIGHSRAMDMILTGRSVSADEALAFGLVNRLCDPGAALGVATELAHQLSQLPQNCLRGDRASSIEQWGHSETEALQREYEIGFGVLRSGESQAGAHRFREGAGRHGATA